LGAQGLAIKPSANKSTHMKFTEFGFDEGLLEAISYMGFETASPIQERAIPEILQGKDIIACAQTGTGKTAAFILPTLQGLISADKKGVSALVICPTRELAIQIEQQFQAIAYFLNLSSIAIFGGGSGQGFSEQKKALKEGADIVVATPGKLISHLNLGYVNIKDLKYLILDEADRMLDMGFADDLKKIMGYLPKSRQTMMFSATMPPNIRTMAAKTLKAPFAEVSIAISKPSENILQIAYLASDHQKAALIESLIRDKDNYKSILIFCSTKKKVSELYQVLARNKHQVKRISSDLDQGEREAVLNLFAAKKIRILVATDVLSRGIDIKEIHLVINYDVPPDPEDYVHRIGRTARADTTGLAITLINEKDMQGFARTEKLIEKEIKKLNVPPELGESPVWNPKSRGGGRGGGRGGNRGGGRGGNRGRGNRSRGNRSGGNRSGGGRGGNRGGGSNKR